MEGKEKSRNHRSWASEGRRSAGLGHTERMLKWGALGVRHRLGSPYLATAECLAGEVSMVLLCVVRAPNTLPSRSSESGCPGIWPAKRLTRICQSCQQRLLSHD